MTDSSRDCFATLHDEVVCMLHSVFVPSSLSHVDYVMMFAGHLLVQEITSSDFPIRTTFPVVKSTDRLPVVALDGNVNLAKQQSCYDRC